MLQQMRRASKSWIAVAIIGALIAAFALWGVGDIFLGRVSNAVATVGDTQITTTDFSQELRQQMQIIGQQTGSPLTLDDARNFGLGDYVLQNMIARAALDEKARELGLTASDALVAEAIRTMPAFTGVDGAFNRALFQQTLIQNGLSEAMFVETVRRDIARNQLVETVSESVTAPLGLALLFHEFVNEMRVAEYIVLTPEDAGEIAEPTEQELADFHTAQSARFSAPEYREFEYVAITPETVADQVEVTDAEVMAEFEARRAEYEQPERRTIEQIVFPTREEAAAAAMRIAAGEDFASIAEERGLMPEDYQLGTLTADDLDPGLAEAAFALAEGGVSDPVEGPFGWVLLRATSVTPATSVEFEDVQDMVREELIAARSRGAMINLANAFEDERGAGAQLSEAAAAVGLTVHHVQAMDNQGLTPEDTPADIPAEPSLLEQVFAWEDGEESNLFEGDDGNYYAVRVVSVTPSELKPLEEVREEVRAALMAQRRATALQTRAQELAALASAMGLEAAAEAAGKTIQTSEPRRRDMPNEVLSTAALQRLFAVPPGTIINAPAANGTDYVIARPVEVLHPEADLSDPANTDFTDVTAQQLAEDWIAALAAAAQAEAGVSINTTLLQQMMGEVPL